jgi:hypothetical protein
LIFSIRRSTRDRRPQYLSRALVAERTRRCGRRRDDLGRIRQDVVYHLAGYVSGSRELDAVLPSLRNNPVSAVNVLVAAARIGCIITSLLRAERPKLSSGTRPVDWVYVDDVVDAFIAASARDDLAGASLDIGTGELVTIRAIVEQIVETVGQESSRLGSAPGAPTRDSSRRRRRTDEGPSRLGAPNSPHPRGCGPPSTGSEPSSSATNNLS